MNKQLANLITLTNTLLLQEDGISTESWDALSEVIRECGDYQFMHWFFCTGSIKGTDGKTYLVNKEDVYHE